MTPQQLLAGSLEIQGLRLKQEVIDGFDLPFSCISGGSAASLSLSMAAICRQIFWPCIVIIQRGSRSSTYLLILVHAKTGQTTVQSLRLQQASSFQVPREPLMVKLSQGRSGPTAAFKLDCCGGVAASVEKIRIQLSWLHNYSSPISLTISGAALYTRTRRNPQVLDCIDHAVRVSPAMRRKYIPLPLAHPAFDRVLPEHAADTCILRHRMQHAASNSCCPGSE